MKNLIEYIVIHLVEHPEEVKIAEEQKADFTQYTISVHDDDIGRIIGKKGSVISAIRQIVKIKAIKDGVMVRVDVATEDREEPVTATPITEEQPAIESAQVDETTEEIENS